MAFREEELLVVKESETMTLRVVDWNGRKYLVKQTRWVDEKTGELNNGKVKGLTAEDLEVILENIDDIKIQLAPSITRRS